MRGVSRYFSKASGSGVDLTLLKLDISHLILSSLAMTNFSARQLVKTCFDTVVEALS